MISIQIQNNKAVIRTNKPIQSLCHRGTNDLDLTRVPALNRYIARNPTAVIEHQLIPIIQ